MAYVRSYSIKKPMNELIPEFQARIKRAIEGGGTGPDPEPEPGPDPEPEPEPEPGTLYPIAMVRRDVLEPVVIGSLADTGVRETGMTEHDVYGRFTSRDAAGEYSVGMVDANNRFRFRFGGNFGASFIVERIANGQPSTLFDKSPIARVAADETIRFRHLHRIEGGVAKSYIAVLFGSSILWESGGFIPGFGGTKIAWQTGATPPASDVTISAAAYPIATGQAKPVAVRDRRARVPVYYVTFPSQPNPQGIEIRQVDAVTSAEVIPWEDAILVASPSGADLDAVQPTAYRGNLARRLRAEVRHKVAPDLKATAEIFYPKRAEIGMNIAPQSFLAGERMFKNLLKLSEWRLGSLYLGEDPTYVDPATGTLIRLPDNGTPTRPFGFCDVPGSRCELTWDGPADAYDLSEGNNATYANIDRSVPNRIAFDYNFSWEKTGWGNIQVRKLAGNPYLKEVSMSRDGGDIAPLFKQRYSKYGYVRLMDLMGSNAINGVPSFDGYNYEWSDRAPMDYFAPHRLGLSVEHIIELLNGAEIDGWLMMPAGSSPDYDRRFVRALFYGEGTAGGVKLAPDRSIRLEKGNEWFNASFGIYHQAAAAAIAHGRATSATAENDRRIIEQAYRCKLMFDAVEGNYPAGRLSRMLMDNPTTYALSIMVENYGVTNFEIGGCGFYFFNVHFGADSSAWPGKDKEKLFAVARDGLAASAASIKPVRDWLVDRGYGYEVYEGQQHWFEPSERQPYYDEAFNKEFQQSPEMESVIKEWLTLWIEFFGSGLTLYSSIGAPNLKFGSWGFQLNQSDASLALSPKQRAVNAVLAAQAE